MTTDAGRRTRTERTTEASGAEPDERATGPGTPDGPLAWLARKDRFAVWFAVLVVVQALWLAGLMNAGWYYQADFSNLAAATGRPLGWAYLSQSQGGHLDLLGRVVYWILNRVAPLNHPLTILLRVLAQGWATYLLGRLLVLLVGRRPGVLLVLAMYAFSPLLVQSTLWFTASVGLLPSQIFVLLALHAYVRYDRTRRLRYAGLTGLAFLAATLVSEQAAVTALMLPLLSFGYLHAGTARRRLVETVRSWPAYLMTAAPVGVFVLFFLGSGKYHKGSLHTGLGSFAQSVWTEWTYCIVPAIPGGPWTWFHGRDQYFSLSDPAPATRIVAAVIAAAVIAYTVRRRTGAWALLAWSMPFLVSGVGIVVVAAGRFTGLGIIIAKQFEHAAYAAVPLAVAAALAFWPASPEEIDRRLAAADHPDPATASSRAGRRRLPRYLPTGLALAVLVSSAVTAITYTARWSQSPSERFVTTLRHELDAAGPGLSLFDTYLPVRIQPGINDYRRVSDLVRLIDPDVTYDGGRNPRVVDQNGHLARAAFLPIARVDTNGPSTFCNDPVAGVQEHLQVLSHQPDRNEWFVKVTYFQQYPSILYLYALDEAGHRITPVGGARVLLSGHLADAYVRLPSSRPVSLVVRGATPTTKVCLTGLSVGYPFAREGGS